MTKTGIKKLTPNDKARMKQSCELMASEALRLLAFAKRQLEPTALEKEDDEIEHNLVFLGLIGLQDPPHASSKESISRCKKAGIKPVMITGDHPDTARAIAKELGILEAGIDYSLAMNLKICQRRNLTIASKTLLSMLV
ncbi:cation efflux transporter [Legionella pneumophila]|nr:cation efflux transporter [Legionella pneumophila]